MPPDSGLGGIVGRGMRLKEGAGIDTERYTGLFNYPCFFAGRIPRGAL